MTLDIETKNLVELTKWLRTADRKFAIASAMWLNRAAYHTRIGAGKNIEKKMTVRSSKFIQGRLRYEKVRHSASLREQVAFAGSVETKRFGAWAAQEPESATKKEGARKRTITLAARSGNKSKRVAPRARLKPGKKFISPADYHGRSNQARGNMMLQHLDRINYRKPFLIRKFHGLKSGLYIRKGRRGNLVALQIFKKPKSTKKRAWNRPAAERYFRTVNTRAVWSDIVTRVVMPRRA